MHTSNGGKKPASGAVDWHRADIVAALHKAGWSLRKLSREAGLSDGALNNALDRPWPKAERIIAAAIDEAPEHIWPSRYAKRHFKPVFPLLPPSSVGPSMPSDAVVG
ncbi:helix-turn-helix domain-containing protein [Chromobacterium subtsugae]|uniref:helix-turn-helix domain-containing protein n=1 Tax=Chromobacterium subtsugae TaxID=251747 RepID=UPI0009B973BE|nr:helix-turn-helix domain-containing protein [Chromobacterium subtsugae]